MSEAEPHVSEMPHLYNVFDVPKMKSVRATTILHPKIDLKEILDRLPKVSKLRTSNKNVVKFQLKRGSYLLLFPTNYVEVHAPDEGAMREVLIAFRDELFKNGLL